MTFAHSVAAFNDRSQADAVMAADMKVLDVMTTPVISVSPETDIVDAVRLMLQNRIDYRQRSA